MVAYFLPKMFLFKKKKYLMLKDLSSLYVQPFFYLESKAQQQIILTHVTTCYTGTSKKKVDFVLFFILVVKFKKLRAALYTQSIHIG